MSAGPARIAVLASGVGSNLQVLIDELHGREARIVAVASDLADAPALARAGAAGIAVEAFPLAGYADRNERDTAMADWICAQGATLVVCAGYMALLTPRFLARFAGAVVNVHPSLLPAFPGLRAIEAALAAGVRETGVTVHLVDDGLDTGPVLAREAVAVGENDTRDSLASRIREVEHRLLPAVVRGLIAGEGRSVRITRALISVSDTTGLDQVATGLHELGVQIVASAGTARVLAAAGVPASSVEELTGVGELLGGRVKTLHPKVHAALLARRDSEQDMNDLRELGVEPFDLVICNLYPFRRLSGRRDVSQAEQLEAIDIGGVAILRAAAKNHAHVAVVVDPDRYGFLIAEMREDGGVGTATRRDLAEEAFAHTAGYDIAIANWFSDSETFPDRITREFVKVTELPYGENPHQRGAYYLEAGTRRHLLSRVTQHAGKPLSFNNLLDLDSATAMVREFTLPACAIVKHANPCGVALAATIEEAYARALAADPMSAYGGVIAINRPVSAALADALADQFFEVLHAPGFAPDVLSLLAERRKGARLLEDAERRRPTPGERDYRRVLGGMLVQDRDTESEDRSLMEVVTRTSPDEREWGDLLFAWRVCKHVRSNAIVICRDLATVGVGAGQMSRVDAVRVALDKALTPVEGAVLASDAYFPFADGVDAAVGKGVRAVIQPGGSVRDDDVVTAADAAGISMVFTGRRHFRH